MPATLTAPVITTQAQEDAVLDVVDELVRTEHNHHIDVSRGRFACDRTHNGQPGVWVTGTKYAACDRTAFVTDTGVIEWVR